MVSYTSILRCTAAWALVVALNGVDTAHGQVGSCIDELSPVSFRQLRSGDMTYVVSDYGWSDAWYVAPGTVGEPSYDVLSGDDSPNLHYDINGRPAGGNGWLTPCMDAGALTPSYPTGSLWAVAEPVHYITAPTVTESRILQPQHGLEITITTEVIGFQLSQTFEIANNGDSVLENLILADYFNAHPNGTAPPSHLLGTISYAAGGLTIEGAAGPTHLMNPSMSGQRLDDARAVGSIFSVINMVESNTFDGSTGPVGPADSAGALAWNLGALAPGESVSFTVEKTPEPGTLGLLTALILIASPSNTQRRKLNRAN